MDDTPKGNVATENYVEKVIRPVEQELSEHVESHSIHVTSAKKEEWDAKYKKPVGGIPMADLAPNKFPPESHTHTLNNVTGLQEELEDIRETITDLDDVKHGDFEDIEEKQNMTLKEVGEMINIIIRKLKGTVVAAAALIASFAYADLGPDTDFGDISPTAKVGVVVSSAGAIMSEADPTVADWAKKPNPAPATDLTPAIEYTTAVSNRMESTKQATITDLNTIRSGAALGATAVQPAAISDMETRTHAGDTYQPKGNYLTAETDPTVAAKIDNTVTTAFIRERLGVYLYVGEDGGIYVHTGEE